MRSLMSLKFIFYELRSGVPGIAALIISLGANGLIMSLALATLLLRPDDELIYPKFLFLFGV